MASTVESMAFQLARKNDRSSHGGWKHCLPRTGAFYRYSDLIQALGMSELCMATLQHIGRCVKALSKALLVFGLGTRVSGLCASHFVLHCRDEVRPALAQSQTL